MRIKPKNQKLLAVRRSILGVGALGLALFLLLSGRGDEGMEDLENTPAEVATTAVPEVRSQGGADRPQ